MKDNLGIFALILFLLSGCSSSISPKTALESELQSQIQAFYHAVLDKNSDQVYSFISSDLGKKFDKRSFKTYFTENYDIFLEYAQMIRDDNMVFELSSQPEGDICGTLRMELDDDGNWRLSDLPDKLLSIEEQKQNIISILQSNIFSKALNDYGLRHPEFTGTEQRIIRRGIQFRNLSPDDIQFSGSQVIITLPENAVIRMECTSKAWRLVQCSLLH